MACKECVYNTTLRSLRIAENKTAFFSVFLQDNSRRKDSPHQLSRFSKLVQNLIQVQLLLSCFRVG